jgi:two-component system copper resistance phosphate regulon response regulator CusR
MNNEQTKRILVLEDEPQTGALIEKGLTDAGYVVHLAEAVPGALHLIDDLAFDAAILSLGIGTSTTVPVAESLRVRLIPFVFCTTDDDLPAGFEDVPVLGKPFTPDEMIGIVRSVFGPPRRSRRIVV